ncbi:MAG TPA: c-type cytochrome domain-containing protein [Planctomycetota bacterium]|nr:c-type cytochrome domain-containing protein [Planctomycetota bacterium]
MSLQTARRPSILLPFALALLALLSAPTALRVEGAEEKAGEAAPKNELPPAASIEVDFTKHIEPILEKHCIKCHGAEKAKSDFRLVDREAALKGGDGGVAIIPGKSAESPLILFVAGLDEETLMPPPKNERLTPEEISILRAWVDQGLKWPAKVVVAAKPKEWLPLEGQKTWATSVAFGPDGNTLAVGGGHTLIFKPGEVHIWDTAEKKEKAALNGHSSTVWSVAFDKEGKRLATGSYDKRVKVWDVPGEKELLSWEGHANWVTCVAFSPGGALLATGSEDTLVKLWNAADGKERGSLKGHAATVRSVAFSPDGALLASASFDGTVKVWDVEKAVELSTLKGHEGAVWSVVFAPGSKLLATGGADGTVRLWQSPDGAADLAQRAAFVEKAVLKGHKNWVSCVAFSRDGRDLASGGFDRSVILWDAGKAEIVDTLEDLPSTVWSISFQPDGSRIAFASGTTEGTDGTVKFWPLPRAF